MQVAMNRFASVLSGLEGGEPGCIKLQTSLNLNEKSGNSHDEIGMFREAAWYQSLTSEKIKLKASYVTSARETGDVLITLSRWQQMQMFPDWPRDYRKHIKSLIFDRIAW